MVRGSNYSRTAGGGVSSWDAYEPNGGGRNNGGGRHSARSNRRQQPAADDQQDAIWEDYDRVHGNAHPNNADVVRRPPRRPDDDNRQTKLDRPRGRNRNPYGDDHDGKHASGGGRSNAIDAENDGNGENNYSSNNRGSNRQQPSFHNQNDNSFPSGHNDRYHRPNNNNKNNTNERSNGSHGNRIPQPSSQRQQQSHDNASSNYDRSRTNNKVQLQVLYTHQKTKKKKSWKDGRLTLSGASGTLYEACPNPGSSGAAIDAVELSRDEARALADGLYGDDPLESEKFLIQVEGPWTSGGDGNDDMLWNKRRPQALQSGREKPKPSLGMKKVLRTKFRVPKRIRPVHPQEKRERAWRETGMNKRSRPLQPGELERQFYGSGGGRHQGYPGDGGGSYGGQDGGGRGGPHGGRESYGSNNRDGGGGDWEENDFGQKNQSYQNDDRNPGQRNHDGWGNNEHGGNRTGNQGCHQSSQYYDSRTSSNDCNERVDNSANRGSQQSQSGSRDQQSFDMTYGESNRGRGSVVDRREQGGRNNGPAQFQSNEYDPNGFYGEEEESEEEDEEGQQHGGDATNVAPAAGGDGRGGRLHKQNGNNEVQCETGDSYAQQQGAVQDRQPRNDNYNNEMSKSTSNDSHPNEGHGEHQEEGQSKMVQQKEARSAQVVSMPPPPHAPQNNHHHATSDELLALFGAAPAPPEKSPAPRQTSQVSPPTTSELANASDQCDTGNEASQTTGNNDSNHPTENDKEGEDNSFLASILQAEEQANNRGVATGGDHSGGLSFSCDGLGGWGDDGDFEDDHDDDEGDDGGNDGDGKTMDDTEMDKGGKIRNNDDLPQNFSAFNLPSAGESSSEDEDD